MWSKSIGAFLAISGGISVGNLTALLSYANQYTKPFNEISGVVTELQNALACARRVFELIEEEAEIPDAENAVVLDEVISGKENGRVAMENVALLNAPEHDKLYNLCHSTGLNLSVLNGLTLENADHADVDQPEKAVTALQEVVGNQHEIVEIENEACR